MMFVIYMTRSEILNMYIQLFMLAIMFDDEVVRNEH